MSDPRRSEASGMGGEQRGQEVGVLRERQRQFPCAVPSAGQGHTFYDLTALRLARTAPPPQHISCSAPAVVFGTTQEGPNVEAGWRPKQGREPAKRLWSSIRVSPGRRNMSAHPSRGTTLNHPELTRHHQWLIARLALTPCGSVCGWSSRRAFVGRCTEHRCSAPSCNRSCETKERWSCN